MPIQPSVFLYGPNPCSYIPSSSTITARHRSGSFASPGDTQVPSTYSLSGYHSYRGSGSLDDTESSTIASTLASLGLNDDSEGDRRSISSIITTSDHSIATTSYFTDPTGRITPSRHRAHTVAARTPMERSDHSETEHLAFNPFSPETRASIPNRPRAASVGMTDATSFQSRRQTSAFAPFDRPFHRLQSDLDAQFGHYQQAHILRSTRSSNNLFDLSRDMYYRLPPVSQVDNLVAPPSPPTCASAAESQNPVKPFARTGEDEGCPSSSEPSQICSRALWLGNINPALSVSDLIQLFSCYGQVESARILSDKECAFVNFVTVDSAIAAKHDIESRLGNQVAGTTVRVGFGKADVNLAITLSNEAGPNAQGPTRALWIGNLPVNTTPAILRSLFQPYGPIESVRVLSHKNCGFVNFQFQEDAVRARKMLQNKEVLGPGTGIVRIGFAKVPINNIMDEDDPLSLNSTLSNISTPESYQATQWATAMMVTRMMMHSSGQEQEILSETEPSSLYRAIEAERRFIMQQLGQPMDKTQVQREPLSYRSVIPTAPELASDRKIEPLRLREIRKGFDSRQALGDVENIARECMEEILELCSDYIGNTVVQKLFEHCSEDSKEEMLQRISPLLASIGVHKNGTWAAQKIIDHANTDTQGLHQIHLICTNVAPYVPLLLLDQFGNYVVQCCLRMGPERNQYIFDAIVDKCWEIGQGRFGARSIRAILENPVVTKEQRVYVAAAIAQNAVLLTTNANGTILLLWLLDSSDLPGRYRVLCPRLLPYLSKLGKHKLGSITIYKVLNQQQEPDARTMLLNAIVYDADVLDDILKDQVHGVGLIQKILSIPHLEKRDVIVQKIKESVIGRLNLQHVQGYKKLLDELEQVCQSSAERTGSSSCSTDTPWLQNPQAVAMMANMYAAAMAAATNTQFQTSMPDMAQVDRLMQKLLNNSNNNITGGNNSFSSDDSKQDDK
ncbi:hypothetical protein EC973_002918 [Apophysomyces ossiformis]|uniref:ARM repeat-containing protein n=1 Tax=Apophysomyces ossiformis TaxID=679940 RepID=A0A8H7EMA5_9FUNG|nr:hypothetical protein EC973_002918 [Apophysomyces ossiformis]